LLLDEHGKPVTRWDGETTRVSSVTGEKIPDEKARVPVYRYVNPHKAEWPKADFIIGNPPYIGNRLMRSVLGDGYAEAVRDTYSSIPETSDYVLYWWDKAATVTADRKTRRFGLITTNSISQVFGRRVVDAHLRGKKPLSLVFAIPDHPWVDSVDGASVRVAMTCGEAGSSTGILRTVVHETPGEDEAEVSFSDARGIIHSDLSVGAEVGSAEQLTANSRLAYQGVKLHGEGFVLDAHQAAAIEKEQGSAKFLRPYMNGRDLASIPRDVRVIDLFGLEDEVTVRKKAPVLYQWLLQRVKPERDQNQRQVYRERWWLFAEPRPGMRRALAGLDRFIATVETSKHRFFVFLDHDLLPDQKLRVIAHADSYILGVLSSHAHLAWALATGSTLEDRPVWNNSTCFEPFPFPVDVAAQRRHIRELGEALDAHRWERQDQHPSLTLTDKERVIHEQGLISVLKQIHDDLDAAVFDAYGWPATLTDEEILERLVALNHERAEEEKQGLIRWLRPEFQNPQGTKAATQVSLVEAGLDTGKQAKVTKGKKAAKRAWPKGLPARVAAVRDLLGELGEATAEDFPQRFKEVKAAQAEKLLESLAAVGVAVETTTGPKAARSWRLLR
jgi:hypothetical protein